MNQIETSSTYWASVHQQHDAFVEQATREMEIEGSQHSNETDMHGVFQDTVSFGEDAEIAERVLA